MPRPPSTSVPSPTHRAAAGLAAGFLVLLAMCGPGCRGAKAASQASGGTNAPAVFRPLDGSVGKVVQVNERLRFAVLDYTLNRMPEPGTVLLLYRSTNVVGSLKLSGWRNALTAAADFVDGSPQVGDVARPR